VTRLRSLRGYGDFPWFSRTSRRIPNQLMMAPNNPPQLILASRNEKKIREIHELLKPHGIVVAGVSDFPDVPDVVEDRDTFQGNAEKKAGETARLIGQWTLAEDSGLCVDALGGEPGVYSARYAGEEGSREERDRRNNEKLIQALKNVPIEKRSAHYVCHVAVADPAGAIRLNVEATCGGRIIDEARGDHGFGYDPHFLLPEYHRTFGELSSLVKNQLSHRARAFQRLIPKLAALLKSN
jgi:XTP/dITP diphosphohydrolase